MAETPPTDDLNGLPTDQELNRLQWTTVLYYLHETNPDNGLVRDKTDPAAPCSIAAVGLALATIPVVVERGVIIRKFAAKIARRRLRNLLDLPQGPTPDVAGYKGFFYHFLDMKTGERFEESELSTVDTALFLAGALFCQSYFDGPSAEEVEIRELVEEIYRRVDWKWAQARPPAINHGWTPADGFMEYDWRGYNEAMLLYIIAMGSPTFPVNADAWTEWTSTYDKNWRKDFGQEYLGFAPLFGHQYSHVWLDLRDIQDAYMRKRGLDYFENSRRAVYAQQAYAVANPLRCTDYGTTIWGITASDGPADVEIEDASGRRTFRSYTARGIGGAAMHDDCTLAPTAAASSIPFAPEVAIPAVLDMHKRYGRYIYSMYGFLDAFNLSFHSDVPLRHGRSVPGFGWVDVDYLGIDQGVICAMIENYRTAIVWRVMKRNAHVRRGLERAGFSGGWLAATK